jgi:histidinol-phosphate aminotransferase
MKAGGMETIMPIVPNPWVAKLEAYVPGEQPKESGYIKLNTNESPFPPSPDVIDAIRKAADDGSFQKYPNPKSSALRLAIAERLGVTTDEVLIGNGSDEVLRLLCHAFLDADSGDKIAMLKPTYSLYHTLAAMFGCGHETYPVNGTDSALPQNAIAADARIFFLANPNPPYGTFYGPEQLERLASANQNRLVVIDEAYVDFGPHDAMSAYRTHDNVVITRTFSKSYSLAGLRVGFAVARPSIIDELEKIRDSYNVNWVSQVGALAAWNAADYYRQKSAEIRANREFLRNELARRGFDAPASEGNFVFARRAGAKDLYSALKDRKILIRYFSSPELADGVRITIGTRDELQSLLSAIDQLAD